MKRDGEGVKERLKKKTRWMEKDRKKFNSIQFNTIRCAAANTEKTPM